MVKVIEEKPVPTAQVRCKGCGSLLEYSNLDLWKESDVDCFTYPLPYKYSFDCPVCKCKIYVERVALKGEEDKVDKKDYRERYKRIAESENFKKHYEGKSLGEVIDAGDNLPSVWHKGSEKPSIYKDKLTGNTLETYALCIIWYDGWVEDLCQVTEDHIFISMTSGKTYLPTDFEYWAYTHDLIPKDL